MKMLKLFFFLTFLTGILYPYAMTLLGLTLFPEKARGSLVRSEGKVIGSLLLAQAFTREDFFHPRPSATDFETIGSGGSQSSPTNEKGQRLFRERMHALPSAGNDAWTASGSGLDPHISPETAWAQVPRVAAARGLREDELRQIVDQQIEHPTLGIWGRPRVNVLTLNSHLETQGGHGNSGRTSQKP